MKFILFFLSALFLLSCKGDNNIIANKGNIKIINNIYFDASKSLDNFRSFYISNLNFYDNAFVEIIPSLEFPGIYVDSFFIKDSIFYPLGDPQDIGKINIFEIAHSTTGIPIQEKTIGALFGDDIIPNYDSKIDISDTVLFNKQFKRFEIETPQSFSRYYINKTDTILPYSISRLVESEYNGRIERIDTYDKVNDIFMTVQLIVSYDWDENAEAFFEYTEFLNNTKNTN